MPAEQRTLTFGMLLKTAMWRWLAMSLQHRLRSGSVSGSSYRKAKIRHGPGCRRAAPASSDRRSWALWWSQSESRVPEIGTLGLMSGDGKRGAGHRPQATAPILDSTFFTVATSSVARQGTVLHLPW